jgi:hypothetical protein
MAAVAALDGIFVDFAAALRTANGGRVIAVVLGDFLKILIA